MGYVQKTYPIFYFNTASHVFTINTSLPPKKSKRKDSLHAVRNDNHVILNGTKYSEESPAMIDGGNPHIHSE